MLRTHRSRSDRSSAVSKGLDAAQVMLSKGSFQRCEMGEGPDHATRAQAGSRVHSDRVGLR